MLTRRRLPPECSPARLLVPQLRHCPKLRLGVARAYFCNPDLRGEHPAKLALCA